MFIIHFLKNQVQIILSVSPSSGLTISFKLLYWDNKHIIHVVLAPHWFPFEFQVSFRLLFLVSKIKFKGASP